jgi:hypothetical protein
MFVKVFKFRCLPNTVNLFFSRQTHGIVIIIHLEIVTHTALIDVLDKTCSRLSKFSNIGIEKGNSLCAFYNYTRSWDPAPAKTFAPGHLIHQQASFSDSTLLSYQRLPFV